MTFLNKMDTIKSQAQNILENYKLARNSDVHLIRWLFIVHYKLDPLESFDSVINRVLNGDLPCFESIRRNRQRIQENGDLSASSNVVKIRKELEKNVKDQVSKEVTRENPERKPLKKICVNNGTMQMVEVRWDGEVSRCNKCGEEIGWGHTKRGLRMPFDFDDNNTCHFANCGKLKEKE